VEENRVSQDPEALNVLLAQSGDRDALDDLFKAIQEPLFHRVLAIVGHRDLAQDVLQDVFILVQRKLKHLKAPEHFRAWAFRIAARESIRQSVRERRRFTKTADADQLDGITDSRAVEPIRSLAAGEAVELIRSLPARSRVVLTLHYLDDLPLREVSDVLDIPLGTVKSRLSYGLNALRRTLLSDPAATSRSTREVIMSNEALDQARIRALAEAEKSERFSRLMLGLAGIFESIVLIALFFAIDWGDPTHRVIFLSACLVYAPLAFGLVSLHGALDGASRRVLAGLRHGVDE
jgi:RNA polymerase sigma-70 factor, ECF subfamily